MVSAVPPEFDREFTDHRDRRQVPATPGQAVAGVAVGGALLSPQKMLLLQRAMGNRSVAGYLADGQQPGARPASGALIRDRRGPAAGHSAAGAPLGIQRLVVNVGEDSLRDELAKPVGWIIASDIDQALQKGGEDQDIEELDDLNDQSTAVDADEDIYLVGHGSPWMVGARLPEEVADALMHVIPNAYAGIVRSLSCSTGVVDAARRSAVSSLQQALGHQGPPVTGVSGVALSHPAYESGSRGVTDEKFDKYVDPQIEKTIGSVNEDWIRWVNKNKGIPDIKKAALMATKVFSHELLRAPAAEDPGGT